MKNFFLLAGPCVIENEDMAMHIAEHITDVTARLGIPYTFKGSYRKANRSRLDSFTGIGDEKALRILRKIHETFDIPVMTDIHSAEEATLPTDRPTCCRSKDRQDGQYQEGAVHVTRCHVLCRTKGGGKWQ